MDHHLIRLGQEIDWQGLEKSLADFYSHTAPQKSRKRAQCRSRAAIEPLISHVKFDCKMGRNYLKGQIGDKMNAILAAAAFNLRKAMNESSFWLKIYMKITASTNPRKPYNYQTINLLGLTWVVKE